MRTLIPILFLAAVIMSCSQKTEKQSFDDGEFTYSYETHKGLFHGSYQSFYESGKKRAEGSFSHNMRNGQWSVWDAEGILIASRDYSSFFTPNLIMPEPTNEQILHEPPRNDDGLMNYYKDVTEDNVLYSKRIHRFLPLKTNKSLFDVEKLVNELISRINNGSIKAYYDEDLFNIIDEKLPESGYEIRGLIITEDWFYDNSRMLSESRIVSLCPVVKTDSQEEDIELFRLYYPEIRSIISGIAIKKSNLPEYIKHAEDLFFYHYFYSTIIKEENVYSKRISDYIDNEEDRQREAIRIELNLIETEHDIWANPEKYMQDQADTVDADSSINSDIDLQ